MLKERTIQFLAFFIIGFAVVLVFDKSQHLENTVIGFVPSAVSVIWAKYK